MSKKIENDEFERAVAESLERARVDDVDHSNVTGSGRRREPQIDQTQLEADIRLLIQIFGTPVRRTAENHALLQWPSPSRLRH